MGEIAPEEQFLPFSTIFYYLMLDFHVKTGIRLSLRDKRLFEITEVEITRVNCINPTRKHYGNNRQPTPVLSRYPKSTPVQRRFNPGCPLGYYKKGYQGQTGR